jgi:hypothetical protein
MNVGKNRKKLEDERMHEYFVGVYEKVEECVWSQVEREYDNGAPINFEDS